MISANSFFVPSPQNFHALSVPLSTCTNKMLGVLHVLNTNTHASNDKLLSGQNSGDDLSLFFFFFFFFFLLCFKIFDLNFFFFFFFFFFFVVFSNVA